MPLSFAQAQFALAFVSQIDPARADAFESRLKQWQKMGFPEGVNVGRGVKAVYGATQVFQLLFMLKLLHVGLTPERAQKVVTIGWGAFKDSVVEATICMANREEHLHYCLIQLDALSDLRKDKSEHMHVFVDTFTSDEVQQAFLGDDDFREWIESDGSKMSAEDLKQHHYLRFLTRNRLATCICIEVDSLLALLWLALSPMGIGPDVFAEELAVWERERRERGRVVQSDAAHFEGDIAHESVSNRMRDFDVTDAARSALSLIDRSQLITSNGSMPVVEAASTDLPSS